MLNCYHSLYVSESGWTDTENCELWIKDVFIPFAIARRLDHSKPIVLIMDGHDTHEQPTVKRAIYEVLDNEDIEIILFCFPSKTTHRCQPLDVLVFSAIERRWQAICSDYLKKGIPINRFSVIQAYINGTRDVLTKSLITKAFAKTGIYPVNRAIFTAEDFAPSRASSTIAYVPDSFPVEVGSSDPIDTSGTEWLPESDADSDSSDSSDSETETHDLGEPLEPGSPSTRADVQTREPVSGLMDTLVNLEKEVVHMTRSATADQDLIAIDPPKTLSDDECRRLSKEDLIRELRSTRQQLHCTYKSFHRALSQLSAANAHCTLIQRELGSIKAQLENTKKVRARGSLKTKARFVTSRELRAEFDQEDAQRLERERVAAEKQRVREAGAAKQELQVADDAVNRVFTGKISTYKRGDLRALAIALGIADKGTNADLSSRIKDHLDQHPDLQSNARFSALFIKTSRASQKSVAPLPTDLERSGASTSTSHHHSDCHVIGPSTSYRIQPPAPDIYQQLQVQHHIPYLPFPPPDPDPSCSSDPLSHRSGMSQSPYYYTTFQDHS
jgi:DDE superfamily endonuclease